MCIACILENAMLSTSSSSSNCSTLFRGIAFCLVILLWLIYYLILNEYSLDVIIIPKQDNSYNSIHNFVSFNASITLNKNKTKSLSTTLPLYYVPVPPNDPNSRYNWFIRILVLDSSDPLLPAELSKIELNSLSDHLPYCTMISPQFTKSLLRYEYFIQQPFINAKCALQQEGKKGLQCYYAGNKLDAFTPSWMYFRREDRGGGGLGDRMKGLLTTLLLAFETQRGFGINFQQPASFYSVFDNSYLTWPDRFPWYKTSAQAIKNKVSIPDEATQAQLELAENSVIEHWVMNEGLAGNGDYSIHAPWLNKYNVQVEANMNSVWPLQNSADPAIKHLWKTMGLDKPVDIDRLWPCIFQFLFKFKPDLQTTIDTLLIGLPLIRDNGSIYRRGLICVQYRQGNSVGATFVDSESFNSPDSTKGAMNFIQRLPEYKTNGSKVFVTSDNPNAVELFKTGLGSKFLSFESVPITHIDRSTVEETVKGWLKLIVDFMVLGECEISLVSESGFGSFGIWRNRQSLDRPNTVYRISRNGNIDRYVFNPGNQK